jgi:hypothetical protein
VILVIHLIDIHLKYSMNQSEAAKSTATLTQTGSTMFAELPIELYEGIFTPLCVDWEGKTPNIIKSPQTEQEIVPRSPEDILSI